MTFKIIKYITIFLTIFIINGCDVNPIHDMNSKSVIQIDTIETVDTFEFIIYI